MSTSRRSVHQMGSGAPRCTEKRRRPRPQAAIVCSRHLGLTKGADEQTKARYAFVCGDFRRLHRMGLIACHYRAAKWRHREIELAAHELLQYLDRKSASRRGGAARLGAP